MTAPLPAVAVAPDAYALRVAGLMVAWLDRISTEAARKPLGGYPLSQRRWLNRVDAAAVRVRAGPLEAQP
jgi:hypothetical protein